MSHQSTPASKESLELPQVYVEPVREVVIETVALLKIAKHCSENLPVMVAGSLLGIDNAGVLEVTCAYPFPIPQSKYDPETGELIAEDTDGSEYQVEMMRMLQKVNVDSHCVGWYTSMNFGTSFTADIISDQFNHQSSEEVSNNCVVIMYDPVLSKRGSIVVKAFRLSDKFVEAKRNRSNEFIKSSEIMEELPVRILSSGHVSAYIRCLQDSHKTELDNSYESLSLNSTDATVERSLELVGGVVDDLLQEQQKLQIFARANAKGRQEQIWWLNERLQENAQRRENGEDELSTDFAEMIASAAAAAAAAVPAGGVASAPKAVPEVPSRSEHTLAVGQLNQYVSQINVQVDSGIQKLILSAQCNATN